MNPLQTTIADRRPSTVIEGWPLYLKEGRDYLRAAANGHARRPDVFIPETVYNLVAMGCEKLLMAFLMFNGCLPENHTMTDLARAVEGVTGPQPALRRDLEHLDTYQELCDLDTFQHRAPDAGTIGQILAIGERVASFARATLPEPD